MKIKVEMELTKEQGDTVLGFLQTVGAVMFGLPVSVDTEDDEEDDEEDDGEPNP